MANVSFFKLSHLAAFAPLCLAVSVLYDLIYFRVFGLSISVIPSTINSHIKSSVDLLAFIAAGTFTTLLIASVVEIRRANLPKSEEPTKTSSQYFLRENIDSLIIALTSLTIAIAVDSWQADVFYVFFLSGVFFVVLNLVDVTLSETFGLKFIIWLHSLLTFVTLVCAFSLYSALSLKNETGPSHVSTVDCKQCYLMRVYDDYFMFWDASEKSVKMIAKENVKILAIPAN